MPVTAPGHTGAPDPVLTYGLAMSLTPAERQTLSAVTAILESRIRYDDESVVHDTWIRHRYDGGYSASYAPARAQVVATAWHEAGHAVAALATGARFSSVSVRAGRDSGGRVHAVQPAGELAFVIAAAGQIAEGLRAWTLPGSDAELTAWLEGWKDDGGDARAFRRALGGRGPGGPQGPGGRAEISAWRQAEALLTPRRLQIRQVARALMAWPRHLTYPVVQAIAAGAGPVPGRGPGRPR